MTSYFVQVDPKNTPVYAWVFPVHNFLSYHSIFRDVADITPEQPRSGQWSPQQRSWCVSKYHQVRSFKKIQAEFFPKKKSVRNSQIRKGYRPGSRNLELYGTVENLNKKSDRRESHSGRKKVRDEAMINRVRENSPKRGLRKRGQALRICYLRPPGFFLWGYLKNRVYQERPRSLITLKNNIEEEIKAIKPE